VAAAMKRAVDGYFAAAALAAQDVRANWMSG